MLCSLKQILWMHIDSNSDKVNTYLPTLFNIKESPKKRDFRIGLEIRTKTIYTEHTSPNNSIRAEIMWATSWSVYIHPILSLDFSKSLYFFLKVYQAQRIPESCSSNQLQNQGDNWYPGFLCVPEFERPFQRTALIQTVVIKAKTKPHYLETH